MKTKPDIMSNYFISYVVPCYNVQAYLPKCIESLEKQKLFDKEVQFVMVNDGSTDDTLFLIQRFAERDNRVTVIDQKNQGVSAARNNGLNAATGEYVFFLDGDDYLTDDASKIIYEASNKGNADIIITNAFIVYENAPQKVREWNHCLPLKTGCYSTSDYISQVAKLPTSFKAYKRDVLIQHGIVFDKELKVGEVYAFFIHALCCSKQVSFSERRTMNYVQRQNSAVSTLKPDKDMQIITTLHRIDECANNLMPLLMEKVSYRIGTLALVNSFGILKYSSRSKYNKSIGALLKKIKRDDVYHRLLRETVFNLHHTNKDYLYSLIILLFPTNLSYMMFRLKSILKSNNQ